MQSTAAQAHTLLLKQSALLTLIDVLGDHPPFAEQGVQLHEMCGEAAWARDATLDALRAKLMLAEPTRLGAAQTRLLTVLERDAEAEHAGSTLLCVGALSSAARARVHFVGRNAREAADLDAALEGFPRLPHISWSVAWPEATARKASEASGESGTDVLIFDSAGRWADAQTAMGPCVVAAHGRGVPTMAVWRGETGAPRELLADLALEHRVVVREGTDCTVWIAGLDAALAEHLSGALDEELAALTRAVGADLIR